MPSSKRPSVEWLAGVVIGFVAVIALLSCLAKDAWMATLKSLAVEIGGCVLLDRRNGGIIGAGSWKATNQGDGRSMRVCRSDAPAER